MLFSLPLCDIERATGRRRRWSLRAVSVKAPSDDGFGVHPIKTGAHGDGVLRGTATAVTATIMTGLFFFIFLGEGLGCHHF